MTRQKKKIDSKEIGLDISLILARHLLKTEHLHYGFWTGDLPIEVANLPQAQEKHSEFIISHIPEGVKTILDVGCGVGAFAEKLIGLGYTVDGVTPSKLLAERARERLGDKVQIHQLKFEDLPPEKTYDLILFSESFQYVKLEDALSQSARFLNDGGYLLICDFFKTDQPDQGPMGGGHRLSNFLNQVTNHPFEQIEDVDITENTAPNIDLVNDLYLRAGKPIWNLLDDALQGRRPLFHRFVHWKYRKKIDKLHHKYFSGERNAENFKKYKSYRLLLYKKKE